MDNTNENKKRKLIIKISVAAVICIALAVFLTLSFIPQDLFKDKTFEMVYVMREDEYVDVDQDESFEILKDARMQLSSDDANGGWRFYSEYPIAVEVYQHKGKSIESVRVLLGEKNSYAVIAGLKSYLIGGPELYKRVKEIADKAEIIKEIKTPNYSAKYE